jgi:hypothetical protein
MNPTPDMPSLRIVRRFDVPPDKVFDALTKPDDMRVWWGDDTTFDIDLRVGGRWTITRRQGGVEYPATGEYLGGGTCYATGLDVRAFCQRAGNARGRLGVLV